MIQEGENIMMGKPNATLEEVKEAAKAADAHEFIKRLPIQYHTWLEEAGNGLSGGEKQRLALARAFVKHNEEKQRYQQIEIKTNPYP